MTSSNLLVLQDLYTSIQRKWPIGLTVASVLFGLVIAYLVFASRKYESEGKFYVQVGRGMVSGDRVSLNEDTVSVVETREAEVYSVIDILNSRGLAEQVVDQIGVEAILNARQPASAIPSVDSAEASADVDPMRREKAIIKLRQNLFVDTPRQAATISVRCQIGSPELAQQIVRTVMDLYLTSHVAARQTTGSFEFFNQQFRNEESDVQMARNRIRDFKNQIGVMDITLQKKALRNQISKIEEQIVNVASDISSLDAKIVELRFQVSQTPRELAAEHISGIANQGVDLMRQQLFAVEIEYQNLTTKYHDHHPQVRMKKQELDELLAIYTAQESARTETKNTVNPQLQLLEVELLKTEASRVAQQARLDSLNEQHGDELARLNQLNGHEVELSHLEKTLLLAELNLKTYAAKREESRINLALDSERISNVKIIQPATLVPRAIAPNKAVMVLMGFFLAAIGGIGGCVVSHHVDAPRNRLSQRIYELSPQVNDLRDRRRPATVAH